MSVHYKFKSALEYDTVTFDGLHISVRDLKNAIIQQKRIGKNTDFDLQVTNAQTKEVYEDEETLIPKNTSLLIARIPIAHNNKSKSWEGYGNENTPIARVDEGGPAGKAVDLSSLDASEDDKIRAMMSQSTQDYDPSNYMKIRGANQVGVVPPNYRCYKCHQSGHWIKDCPLSQGPEPIEIKKSTGIPRSFMVPVEGPQVQGAMMTPNGSYAVPVLDHQTYTQKQHPAPPSKPPEEQPDIPEDLICSICSGLLSDAVMIPCCGNSFCDECIRGSLLESEEHECPDCHERDISPGTLIPNRYLRNSVANFKNTTGYIKKPTFRQQQLQRASVGQVVPGQEGEIIELEKKEPDVVKPVDSKPDKEGTPDEPVRADSAEKTIISEADSTELVKSTMKLDVSKELEVPEVKKEELVKPEILASGEGPPGVSPRRERSPRREKSPKRSSSKRSSHSSSNGRNPRGPRDMSPRRHSRRGSPFNSLSRVEERAGTPTVDEPRNSLPSNGNYGSSSYSGGGPPGVLPPMMGMPPPHMQGPPPTYSQGQPPPGVFSSQGPPPNFRLPPPGSNPPAPYMGPYNAPPRPMFDHSRPPLQGPPPSYGGYPPRSRTRDYGPSRMRTRTPPGIIDDPLEAFNRMLREKDERERRAKQRKGRSYSRSSSRSYSRSPKRGRSRSPGRRRSRSRSRSFSMSRSRSFSPSPRNTPYREYSPRHVSPRRRPLSRYRSPPPVRSPTRYRYKDQGPLLDRNREREYERHPPRERERERDREHNRPFSRDRDYNAGGYFERERNDGGNRWGGNMRHQPTPMQDNYYPPQMQEPMHHQPLPQGNRYQRDNYQPYKNEQVPHHIPPLIPPHHLNQRRYEDIAPPGTDQPPIPGEELPPRYEDRYSYNHDNKDRYNQEVDNRDARDKEDRRRDEEKPRKHERSPNRPQKSPGKSKDRHESPDKHKKRKHEEAPEKHKKDDDKHKKEASDEDRTKKSKDKKKKKEKREQEKKKRKEKKERHEKKKDEKKKEKETIPEVEEPKKELIMLKTITPEKVPETVEEKPPKDDLYGDLLTSEGVDVKVVENYGKLEEAYDKLEEPSKTPEMKPPDDEPEEGEYPQESETSKDDDVLDLHANELELKSELEKEVLAPLPEKSKWEIDDELSPTIEAKYEGKQDRTGKVTNEVLKRAENAIFAKAINAIRPIEIKKISRDRAKLYSDQKEDGRTITIAAFDEELAAPGTDVIKIESEVLKPPQRLSVKERLGVKVDDLDRIVKVSYDRNRSRSLSPLSKRAREERIHGRDRGRYDRNPSHRREHEERKQREERRRTRSKSHTRREDKGRKRTRSPSASKEHKHKKKDKKQKREKSKKHKREEKDEDKKDEPKEVKPKPTTERRKPTLDEASFEPDYDLDTESEKEEVAEKKVVEEEVPKKKVEEKEKKESSSSDSSDSSSEDERKKKKHRKHKKKRSRKESTSSSSSSDSDSSEEERERKRKKHKKKQKKKKKSKHK